MRNTIAHVIDYCDRIQNGRRSSDVLEAIESEVGELREEVDGANGEDGVFGEAVDVFISTIDIMRMARPDATIEDLLREIDEYADRKCRKWVTKYGDHDYGHPKEEI